MMAVLVACFGEGKQTWSSVLRLADMDWERVFFVGPPFAEEHVRLKDHMEFISIRSADPFEQQVKQVSDALSAVAFGEVGVSLYSGTGLLHMVVLAALLRSGCGVKLVHYTDRFIEV